MAAVQPTGSDNTEKPDAAPQFDKPPFFHSKLVLSVPAQALAAARYCIADMDDQRAYLRGIRISKERISGSDGHVLYDHKFVGDIVHDNSEDDFEGDLIIRPQSSVPAKAQVAVIEIRESVALISYYKDEIQAALQDPIKRDAAPLLAGKFPDFDKVLAITAEEPKPIGRIGFNQGYLALSEKIFRRFANLSHPMLVLHGENAAAHVELKHAEAGNHYFLVMPMRVEDATKAEGADK